MIIPSLPSKHTGEAPYEASSGRLDASKLIISLSERLKPLPLTMDNIQFGEIKTDHMLIASYDPTTGWCAPEIRPYGPLSLDPASSCFQYGTTVFEGMKAYLGPNGEPRLFRPDKNIDRLCRSAERVALPPFDTSELLQLIKKLVLVDSRWMSEATGHSLYIRPTIIGTRSALNVTASDSAMLYVILTPAGRYFTSPASPTPKLNPKGISLFAVRTTAGSRSDQKLGTNYAPGFLSQQKATKLGYSQVLWLVGDKVTEAGTMNLFVVVRRDDGSGDLDIITPALDGTILPGLTRDSCLSLLRAHSSCSDRYTPTMVLPGIPAEQRLHIYERTFTISELYTWTEEGRLVEAFGVGTAVCVVPIGRIGATDAGLLNDSTLKEAVLPEEGATGAIGKALGQRMAEIQVGKVEWGGWSVRCDE